MAVTSSPQVPGPIRLGVLHGDGIGREIVCAAQELTAVALDVVGQPCEWVELPFGRKAIDDLGDPIPGETLMVLDALDAWLLGPHDNANYSPQFRGLSPGGVIRKRYELYANIRPARAIIPEAVCPDMDLVIVRENTEGFYADRNMFDGGGEFMPTADVALAVAVFTRKACERIAHSAFRLAAVRRQHVTIAHKANVLSKTTGLFRDVCIEVGACYPDIAIRGEHVDALAARLVSHSGEYDVVVAENMFGDILSDLTAQLSGSLGMAPSINASADKAMAQASHGSAPDIAGANIANPTAMVLSSAMLLHWMSDRFGNPALREAAEIIERAIRSAVVEGIRTRDIGGHCSTTEFTQQLRNRIL